MFIFSFKLSLNNHDGGHFAPKALDYKRVILICLIVKSTYESFGG